MASRPAMTLNEYSFYTLVNHCLEKAAHLRSGDQATMIRWTNGRLSDILDIYLDGDLDHHRDRQWIEAVFNRCVDLLSSLAADNPTIATIVSETFHTERVSL